MDDPNTVPPTADPNLQPGGQSYDNIVALQTRTAQSNNDLTAQLAASQAEVAAMKSAPPPTTTAPPTTNGAETGGEMFDWDKGMMRLDDGSVNPLLIDTLKKAGMTDTHVTNLLGFTEDGSLYRQSLNDTLIADTVGTQESLDAHLKWGQDNMKPQAFASLSASLNDRNTSKYAMQDLMTQAKAGGFVSGQAPPAPSNEPNSLPQSSGGGMSTTPLIPNSPEAIAAVAEAFASGDSAKVKAVEMRLAASTPR